MAYNWGDIYRVNMADDGTINAVWGEASYKHDGTNGRVMVQIPKFYVKSTNPAANVYRWWISDAEIPGFEIHPAFVQRNHVGAPLDYIYVGAYEADFYYDAPNTHYELHSRTGVQPWTGGQIWEVDFDAGTNEPNIGDDVSTPNDANWFIVDYHLTGGAWDGSGTGKLWIRKPGDAACGWQDNDVITNNTQANQLATCEFTVGALLALVLDIDDAEDYANNIGVGWGITNIWTHRAIMLLAAIEWGDLDSQTEVGRGIVDKAGGVGFAGELTGFDSMDSQMDANGTGHGTGVDGVTPICYRFLENIWGNVWEFVIGYNGVDAEYRIIKEAGVASATMDGVLAGGDYDASTAVPIVADGYISNIEWEALLKYLFIPSAVAGGAATYIPDQWYAHDAGETNILLAGGIWSHGSRAGVGCGDSEDVASLSDRSFGARLEFVG